MHNEEISHSLVNEYIVVEPMLWLKNTQENLVIIFGEFEIFC